MVSRRPGSSLGVEDVLPDNVSSGGPPLQYGIVHTGTNILKNMSDD